MTEFLPITDTPENRQQLARIFSSKALRRRAALLKLLDYLANETMAGRAAALSQNTIASAMVSFDDSANRQSGVTVRASAARLRDALHHYYRTEAAPDEIRLHMPARGYHIAVEKREVVARLQFSVAGEALAPRQSGLAKKISQSDIIGQQGINFVEKLCLDMGFLWTPTGLEAGIDGYIEIRSGAGEVSNCILQVQCKSTQKDFEAETATSFQFRCSPRDLDYWLSGNAPVILILCRPSTNEAYWIALKEYFRDPLLRKTGKVLFEKAKDRFDGAAKIALQRLAIPENSGLYLGTHPKYEIVSSNLLQVASFPNKYYVASTEYRTRGEIFYALRDITKNVSGEWILDSQMLTSFHDLSEYPWNSVCERGTVESLDTAEWSRTDDEARQRHFVQLLNTCLREKLYRKGVKFSRESHCYYFRATPDLSEREYTHQSREHRTSRSVFKGYPKKFDHTQMSYYRHSAFDGRFVRYGEDWYLQITPTYHFTRDGDRLSRYAPDLLSGIKRLENNQAVQGQIVMWAHLLTERTLFDSSSGFLDFGSLLQFELNAGIDDDSWLKYEDLESSSQLENPAIDDRQELLTL